MKKISYKDLDALALGAALLGSGGGSNPAHGKALAGQAIEKYGEVQMIDVDDLSEDSLVIPVSFMGAPLVGSVKKPTGKEFANLIPHVQNHYGRKPTAILAAEIGGSNAFSPLLCAGIIGCPIIDGDTIGRAFPEVHMTSCALLGISNIPTFLSSVDGEVVVIHALGELSLEDLTREITIGFGSKAAIISDIMTGAEAKKAVIPKTYSKAIELGTIILNARKDNIDPVGSLVQKELAQCLGVGVIEMVERNVDSGFVKGKFTVKTKDGDIHIHFINENLIATVNGKTIAVTPDIIIPVERYTAHPLTVEQLDIGKEVALLMIDSHPLWKTEAGLSVVGPKVFGY